MARWDWEYLPSKCIHSHQRELSCKMTRKDSTRGNLLFCTCSPVLTQVLAQCIWQLCIALVHCRCVVCFPSDEVHFLTALSNSPQLPQHPWCLCILRTSGWGPSGQTPSLLTSKWSVRLQRTCHMVRRRPLLCCAGPWTPPLDSSLLSSTPAGSTKFGRRELIHSTVFQQEKLRGLYYLANK